ncbi:primosome assembly protein PriA [Sphingobium indicum IP26]|uniref:HK97 family phage prohead protease n=1 Tax=Sphingobium sp. HDIP04 TaxID=428994 RepID=UPI000377973F|nr:HK97 family phage prohead protease [Sphingobium sp. HDIP04]EPR14138.1 primosome assembly protein PriA [Sphingobium indicum IP26]EQB03607.1 primosome assembly protein PriA [Sphingobium sp. HDIP04]
MLMHFKHGQLKVRDFSLSIKAEAVKDDGTFEGYGSVFGVTDSYGEIVAAGAFTQSLKEIAAKGRPVPVLWQHQSSAPLGVYEALSEDEHGLKVSGRLLIDDVPKAREAHALLKAGAVSGLSIGYWVRKSSYDEKTGVRTLTELDLVEVSLVTFPANDDARIEAVKFKLERGQLPTKSEFEKALREAFPFSKSQAAAIASHGLDHLLRRESEGAGDIKSISDAIAGFNLPKL